MQFGDRLKILRDEKSITQKELGKILNVSDRVIGYYETNNRFPNDETVLRNISEYFNVSVDWLLGLSNSKTRITYDAAYDRKNSFSFQVAELPEDAIKNISEYIEYIKNKYLSRNSDGC